MTEEEKKAIEYYRKKCSDWKKEKEGLEMTDLVIELDEEYQRLDTMINLIEKLKKENEELKSNSIPKDKIRDKLDEIMSYTFTSIEERHQQNYAYDRIRELLEEE